MVLNQSSWWSGNGSLYISRVALQDRHDCGLRQHPIHDGDDGSRYPDDDHPDQYRCNAALQVLVLHAALNRRVNSVFQAVCRVLTAVEWAREYGVRSTFISNMSDD